MPSCCSRWHDIVLLVFKRLLEFSSNAIQSSGDITDYYITYHRSTGWPCDVISPSAERSAKQKLHTMKHHGAMAIQPETHAFSYRIENLLIACRSGFADSAILQTDNELLTHADWWLENEYFSLQTVWNE